MWIPDVLIDIIKDYLYINAKEVLRRYHKSVINASICNLSYDSFHYRDVFGRRRLTVWSIGHLYCPKPEIQLQQSMCITCGEKCNFHPNINGCCVLEWDGEDGTLELEVEEADRHFAIHVDNEDAGETDNEDVDEDVDEDDLYDSWHPWGKYGPDDEEALNDDPYYRNDAYSSNERSNTYSIRK